MWLKKAWLKRMAEKVWLKVWLKRLEKYGCRSMAAEVWLLKFGQLCAYNQPNLNSHTFAAVLFQHNFSLISQTFGKSGANIWLKKAWLKNKRMAEKVWLKVWLIRLEKYGCLSMADCVALNCVALLRCIATETRFYTLRCIAN
jgi:hypothetical protein